MLNSLYKIMDTACECANAVTGTKLSFPRATARGMKVSSLTNGVVGAGLIAASVATRYKSLAILGVVGIVSSGLVYLEAEKIEKRQK